MSNEKRELAILIESVEVPETGMKLDHHTSHLVSARLIWPRTGVAAKTADLSVKLDDGKASLAEANWGKRIILRENVEGRFALALSLTEALDYEKLEKFLRDCFRLAIKAGGDVAAAYSAGASNFVSGPFDATAKLIGTYPGPSLLAEGMAELDASDFPPAGGEKLLTVRLNSSRTLFRTQHRTLKGHTRSLKKVLLKEGDPNGTVTLRIISL